VYLDPRYSGPRLSESAMLHSSLYQIMVDLEVVLECMRVSGYVLEM